MSPWWQFLHRPWRRLGPEPGVGSYQWWHYAPWDPKRSVTSYSNLELAATQAIAEASVALARRLTPGAVSQPPQVDGPQEPWSYGVLGPDLE